MMRIRTIVTVAVHGQSGLLATIADTLAEAGINIEAFALDTQQIQLLTDDARATKSCLAKAGHVTASVETFIVEAEASAEHPGRVETVLSLHGIGTHCFGPGDPYRVYVPIDDREAALEALARVPDARIPQDD